MTPFVIGSEYTHADIVSAFGGDQISYLPQVAGRIVCGRFKTSDMNPNAPYEILVGDLPRVTRKAQILGAQAGPIPVFLKEGTNRWRYHGLMQCVAYDTEREVVARAVGVALRSEEVAGLLRLVDVEGAKPASRGGRPKSKVEQAREQEGNHGTTATAAAASSTSNRYLPAVVAGIVVITAWAIGISGTVVAGTVFGIAGLLVAATTGRRRRRRLF